MISIRFQITNPWSNKFENIRIWSGSTFIRNKCWEFQIYRSSDIINITADLTARTDHAGFHVTIGILGYTAEFNFYDTRHWDNKRNRWHYY